MSKPVTVNKLEQAIGVIREVKVEYGISGTLIGYAISCILHAACATLEQAIVIIENDAAGEGF